MLGLSIFVREEINKMARSKMNCNDCGKDTSIDKGDYYMVSVYIWNRYGLGKGLVYETPDGGICDWEKSGYLCMKCLTKRVGRKLLGNDFIDVPLNYINGYLKK